MRLFYAVNIPAETRRAIWSCADPLRLEAYPIRWTRPESLHVTLKFLGDVPDDLERALIAAADRAVAGTEPFVLSIDSVGTFPKSNRVRVVWAGCSPVAQLETMQRRLEQQTEALGFPTEARTFRPHITLGRAKSGAKKTQLSGVGKQLESVHLSVEFTVESLDLMESKLGASGARYSERYSARLTG
ncbi:MAG: RNA 2',3'-cyclic phosphodiesterase [Gemmatimonadales bacterium]